MQEKSYSIQQLVQNPSFIRWAEGRIERPEETNFWDKWIEKSEYNREKALKAKSRILGYSLDLTKGMPPIDDEWEQLRKRLESPQGQTRTSKTASSFSGSNHTIIPQLLRVAAIIVVIFTASWLIISTNYPNFLSKKELSLQTITTNYKEKKVLRLSDGSKITLAAGSKLSFAKDWLSKPVKRLSLKGEAFFSIAPKKAKGHPKFVVTTEDGNASVWGTQFNVSTYGSGTQVVLKEGKVKLSVKGTADSTSTLTMFPGQLALLRQSNPNIPIKQVNPLVYTSWASDKLVFDQTPLSVLMNRIKRTYGVYIKVEDPNLLQKKLSGSVLFKDLDSLIRSVSGVLNINISREGNTVYLRD